MSDYSWIFSKPINNISTAYRAIYICNRLIYLQQELVVVDALYGKFQVLRDAFVISENLAPFLAGKRHFFQQIASKNYAHTHTTISTKSALMMGYKYDFAPEWSMTIQVIQEGEREREEKKGRK